MSTDDEVETIRAALDFRHVPGFARSHADRDIATLLGIIDGMRAAFGVCDINEATHYCRSHHQDLDIAGITCIEYAVTS